MEIIQIPIDLHGSDIRIRRVHALLEIRKVLETLEQCLGEHAEHIECIAQQFDDSSYDTRELWLNEVMLNNRLAVARELHRSLVQYIPTQQTYDALAHPALCNADVYAEHMQRFAHMVEHSGNTHDEARALLQRIGNIASTAALDYACDALDEGLDTRACTAKLEFLWKFCERGFVDLALAYCQTRGARLLQRIRSRALAIEQQLVQAQPTPLVGSVKARDASQWYSVERARNIVPGRYSDPLLAFEKLARMLEKHSARETATFESCFFDFAIEPERYYIAEQLRHECFRRHVTQPLRECIQNSLDSVIVPRAYASRDIVNLVGMHARAPFADTRARLSQHIRECCAAQITHLARQTRNTKKVISASVLLCHTVYAFDFDIAERFCTTLMNFCSRYTEHRRRTREKKQRCIRRLERYWYRIVDFTKEWKKLSEYIGLYVETKKN